MSATGSVIEVTAAELGQQYFELYYRVHRLVDEAMTSAGLSLSRAKVLMQLSEHGPMNQASLANRLGFAPRSVTDTVDALERESLAVRSLDPTDRRARLVQMTPAGAHALADAVAVKKQVMNQIFGAFDAPTRAEFAALLTAIRSRLTPSDGEISCR